MAPRQFPRTRKSTALPVRWWDRLAPPTRALWRRLRQVELTVTGPYDAARLATTDLRPEFRHPDVAAHRTEPPERLGPSDGLGAYTPPRLATRTLRGVRRLAASFPLREEAMGAL